MNNFSSLGVSDALLRAVDKLGYSSPTAIQEKVIPLLLEGDRDLVALARTGTGKTAAFGLPLLQRLESTPKGPQALVLSPTRELCCQIANDLAGYAAFMNANDILPIYGGTGIRGQILDLRKNPRILVCTPGRLLDHLNRGTVDLSGIRTLVLDEADEMLSMGFKEELEAILSSTPKEKRTCLFSATMPSEIRRIAGEYLDNALEVSVLDDTESAANIEHRYCLVHAQDRVEALRRFVALEQDIFGIVFCRTKEMTRQVADTLAADGLSADALHGDLSQMQREYVMNRFRKGLIRILVATDVAARGLDVDDLTHVIHFELPDDPESYIHRSGRTGRAGKSGISLAVVSPRELPRVRRLEHVIKGRIEKHPAPSGAQILRSRVSRSVDRIEEVMIEDGAVDNYLFEVRERLEAMPKDELIRRILHLQLKEQISAYGSARDLKDPSTDRSSRKRQNGGKFRGSSRGEGDGYRGRGRDFGGEGGRRSRKSRGPAYEGEIATEFSREEISGRYGKKGSHQGEFSGPKRKYGRFGDRDSHRTASEGFVDVKIPWGKADGASRSELLVLVNRHMGRARFPVGRIRIMNKMSIIEVPGDVAKTLGKHFS